MSQNPAKSIFVGTKGSSSRVTFWARALKFGAGGGDGGGDLSIIFSSHILGKSIIVVLVTWGFKYWL